jgi:hypothetical protein
MTKPTIKILDLSTNEEIVREMNAEELALYKFGQDTVKAEEAEAQAKSQAKAALLDKLGITEDEAKLLLS